ncbi:MAG: class I SAM-dependent methyltransferase [candidate division WOR-3 bacterium]|nr:class I SAM-dependent methyltransferase [candidate division WOR-3 bacterium]
MSKKLVREYYSKDCLYEWRRLVQDPYHRLELDTTRHFLRKYLPAKGLVLDAGGGPGRYTIELAKQGYGVILLDLTPGLLEIAKKQIGRAGVKEKVKAVVMGSIDNLNMLPDDHFDAVLCLGGAFSHLVDRRNRNRAGAELVRVAKKKAPVFISVAGRPAKFVNALELLPRGLLSANDAFWNDTLRRGDYRGGYGFTAAHFFTPTELRQELQGRLRVLEMIGLEGFFSTHRREYNRAIGLGKYTKALRELHIDTCTDPVAVGISEHILLVGRKRLHGRPARSSEDENQGQSPDS